MNNEDPVPGPSSSLTNPCPSSENVAHSSSTNASEAVDQPMDVGYEVEIEYVEEKKIDSSVPEEDEKRPDDAPDGMSKASFMQNLGLEGYEEMSSSQESLFPHKLLETIAEDDELFPVFFSFFDEENDSDCDLDEDDNKENIDTSTEEEQMTRDVESFIQLLNFDSNKTEENSATKN